MLKQVADIRDEVLRRCGDNPIDLETIVNVFVERSALDHIVFVKLDIPAANPIKGSFSRWSTQPSAEKPARTIAEIRYADHLSLEWRRFVVCKELCHCLDVADGVCDVSNAAMLNLIDAFSLISAEEEADSSPVLNSELFAHAGALELLFPLQKRREIMAKHGQPDNFAIANIAMDFAVPPKALRHAFNPKSMDAVEWLLKNHS